MPRRTMPRRHPALRFAALILLLVAAITTPTPAQPTPAQPTLSVLTFNIRFGSADDGPNAWPLRRDAVIAVIRGTPTPNQPAPDLVGLQEALAFQLDEILAALPEYAAIGVGRDDGLREGEFSPILYRKDRLRPRASGTRWLSDTPDKPGSRSWGNTIPRIYTWAELDWTPTNATEARRFLVINTHWDHQSEPSRRESAAAIAAFAAQGNRVFLPQIIMGDFNAGLTSQPITWLTTDARLRDTWRDLNPSAPEPQTFCNWQPITGPGQKIDSIFINDRWTTTAATIDRRTITTPAAPNENGGPTPSDHFPVSAVIAPAR